MDNTTSIKLAHALVSVGFNHIAQPPSERAVEVQCRWCRASRKEYIGVDDTKSIKNRVEHDADCPVALAQQESEKSNHG